MASSGPALPPGYAARPATFDDIPAVDAFLQRYEAAIGALPESHAAALRWRWRQPYVDLDRDTRLIEHDGGLVACAAADVEPESSLLNAAGRVDQAHVRHGLGSWIVAWLDRNAAQRGVPTIRVLSLVEDQAGLRLLESAGYAVVRTAWDMGTDLRGDESAPAPPPGVRIRPLEAGEERTLWSVATAAFRDHWDHEREQPFDVFLAQWFGSDDPSRVVLAEVDGRVAGELGWSDGEDAYVFSVGVLREHRGRGIARALLRTAIADAAAAGHRHLYLSVDAENPTGAVAAYERAGLHVLRTIQILDKAV